MNARTIERLVDVAVAYRTAIASGRDPIPAVAARFTITRRAAAQRVYRARAAGLLTATTRGRATRHDERRV